MKRKRRLVFAIVNLLAAAAVAVSAWLPWWHGALPRETDLSQLLSANHLPNVDTIMLSVAMVLFATAGLFVVAAIGAWKLISFIGVLVGGAAIGLWAAAQNLNWSLTTFTNNSVFGVGILCAVFGVLLALLSLFLPKRRERHHWRRNYED